MQTTPNNKGKNLSKVGALSYAVLVKYLYEGLYSCNELSDMTGLHYVTVLGYTRAMYRERILHICAWETDSRGRSAIKIYKLGPGKDAKRTKLTSAERSSAYRKKVRQMNIIRRLHGQA